MKKQMQGIPAQHQKAVRTFLAIKELEGQTMTPKAAYALLQAEWLKREQQQRSKAAAIRREDRANARTDLLASVTRFGMVNDLLLALERDKTLPGFDAQDTALFARSVLRDACRLLERAAIGLDVVPQDYEPLFLSSRESHAE